MSLSPLDIALMLAAQGWPVFPCGSNKAPCISKDDGGRGFLDATTDPEHIKELFRMGGRAARLVGMPTGEATGFDVLDFDYRHGAAAWERENQHRLPETRTHQTKSGGRHQLYGHAPGVYNLASKFAPGMDVRGDGGYIIAPPSRGYTVIADVEIAEWPDWLLEIVVRAAPAEKPRPVTKIPPRDINDKRLSGFTDAVLAKVRLAGEGQKHFALRNAALSMGGIQRAAGLSGTQIQEMLIASLPTTVKDWENAKKTIAWGVEQGSQRPIDLPDRPEYQPRQNGYANGHHVPPAEPTQPASPPAVEDPRRPLITVLAGQRHIASDQGLTALGAADTGFYQRNRSLVMVATAKAKTSDGTVIETPAIVSVGLPSLTRALGQAAEWEKHLKDGTPVRIDPPKEIVEQIACMSDQWPFPPLVGVISTPTMRPDGTVLDKPGYDEPTGLVLTGALKMPAIPLSPTREDADRAMDMLQSLLAEFPFADEPSRSVALSMMLTTVLRGALLPAVPMHVATAPQPGTGKSYLGDLSSAMSTGERCAVISFAPNPEETEKRLIGAALLGQQIIAIDNVTASMSGDFLNQVTERPLLQLRALGKSDVIRIANTFSVFANGNNLSAPADLVRRTLVCRLDANLENPEERIFEQNPVGLVLANRGEYVAACLTIGRAYIAAGRPNPCPRLPSYERWSDLVRSALVWLDMPDPCLSMDLARSEDPERAARTAVFSAWAKEIGLHPNGLAMPELMQEIEATDQHGFLHPEFREACLSVAAERSGTSVSNRRLGKWLSTAKNNRIGDLKLELNLHDPSRPRWRLRRV